MRLGVGASATAVQSLFRFQLGRAPLFWRSLSSWKPSTLSSKGCVWYEADMESCQCQLVYRDKSYLFKMKATHPLSVLLESVREEVFVVPSEKERVPGQAVSTLSTARERESTALALFWVTNGANVQWARSTLLSTVLDTCMANAVSKTSRSVLNLQAHVGSTGETIDIPLELVSEAERTLPIKQRLAELNRELLPLQSQKDALDLHGRNHASRMAWLGLFGLFLQWGLLFRLTFYDLSWDVIEPISYFLTFGTAILGYIFYLVTRKEYSFTTLGDFTASRAQARLYKKHAFPIRTYQRLKEERDRLNDKINQLELKHDQLDKLFVK